MGQGDIRQQTYEKNISLERKFARILKAILGNQFITQDVVMDKQEGTDFAIVTMNPFKVGIRLRRYKYWLNPNYREQFTIRWSLVSGNKTEINKILSGYVNYILYGFVNKEETKIIQYFIGDLNVFRLLNPQPYEIRHNQSANDSDLAIYRLCDMPSDFLIKQWKAKECQGDSQ